MQLFFQCEIPWCFASLSNGTIEHFTWMKLPSGGIVLLGLRTVYRSC
jgi:hypothetical protein